MVGRSVGRIKIINQSVLVSNTNALSGGRRCGGQAVIRLARLFSSVVIRFTRDSIRRKGYRYIRYVIRRLLMLLILCKYSVPFFLDARSSSLPVPSCCWHGASQVSPLTSCSHVSHFSHALNIIFAKRGRRE